MNKEKEIEEMAEVLEQAKINALYTIGSLNNGFGHWYAKALFSAGYGNVKRAVKEFEDYLTEYARACQASGYDGIGAQDIQDKFKEFNGEDKEESK